MKKRDGNSQEAKHIIYAYLEYLTEKKEEVQGGILEAIITENFPQINARYQTTNPAGPGNMKPIQCQGSHTYAYHV